MAKEVGKRTQIRLNKVKDRAIIKFHKLVSDNGENLSSYINMAILFFYRNNKGILIAKVDEKSEEEELPVLAIYLSNKSVQILNELQEKTSLKQTDIVRMILKESIEISDSEYLISNLEMQKLVLTNGADAGRFELRETYKEPERVVVTESKPVKKEPEKKVQAPKKEQSNKEELAPEDALLDSLLGW